MTYKVVGSSIATFKLKLIQAFAIIFSLSDGHLVRLFDGPASLEKGSYHLICVAKDTTMKQLTVRSSPSVYIILELATPGCIIIPLGSPDF